MMTTAPLKKDDTIKTDQPKVPKPPIVQPVGEIGGYKGPEPTRYGDWEQKGRCTDF